MYPPQFLCPSCFLGQDQAPSSESGLNRKWWFQATHGQDRVRGCQAPAYTSIPAPQHSGPLCATLPLPPLLSIQPHCAPLIFSRLPVAVPLPPLSAPLLLPCLHPEMQKSKLLSLHVYVSKPDQACESPMEPAPFLGFSDGLFHLKDVVSLLTLLLSGLCPHSALRGQPHLHLPPPQGSAFWGRSLSSHHC